MSSETILISLGIFFSIVGIILFSVKGAQGQNTIKVLNFELQLSGSSLVFFIVGVGLIVFPFTEYFPRTSVDPVTDSTTVATNSQDCDAAKYLVIRGDALWARGRFENADSAEHYYSQAVELCSDSHRALAQRAQVRIQMKDLVKATEDILKAIEMDATSGSYYAILARIYFLRNDTSMACGEWKKAFSNGYSEESSYASLFCKDLVAKKTEETNEAKVVDPEIEKAWNELTSNETQWAIRCDFTNGDKAWINRNDEIYYSYLGQLVQIGRKIPSSNPQYDWLYSIETQDYLVNMVNLLMGTSQYGVDDSGVIWGQTGAEMAQIGRAYKL